MEQKNSPIMKTKERSVAYPFLNLEQALVLVTKLHGELGKGPYSREDAVRGMGYSSVSGASARAVASLVHYGLLERNGNAYVFSPLAESIVFPTDESGKQRQEAIAKAACLPKIFEKMVTRFQGQALPGLLENILMREGVTSGSAKEVAITFKETMQFAGMLKNGVLSHAVVISDTVPVTPPSSEAASVFVRCGASPVTTTVKRDSFQFADSGGGWNVVVSSSRPLTSEIKKKLIDVSELLEALNVEESEV